MGGGGVKERMHVIGVTMAEGQGGGEGVMACTVERELRRGGLCECVRTVLL